MGGLFQLFWEKCKLFSHVRFFVTPWTVCSLPGSSVRGILQARILEWVAVPSPGALPKPGIKPSSPYCRWILYCLSHQGNPFWGRGGDFQELGHCVLLGLLTVPWNCYWRRKWQPIPGFLPEEPGRLQSMWS